MPSYIALLRGINVSGQKIIRMNDLRESLDRLKFKNVQTYIQSGNVIFQTSRISTAILSEKIKNKIQKDFGFDVSVVTKISSDFKKIIESNPYAKRRGVDLSRVYVTFLSYFPQEDRFQKLDSICSGKDEYVYVGKEIYFYCPNGYGKTKFSNTVVEKLLAVTATTRNWATVKELYRISTLSAALTHSLSGVLEPNKNQK